MRTRRRDPAPDPCEPTGSMEPWPMLTETCECGATLYPRPSRTLDWIWVAADGNAYRDDAPPALREDPAKWWADLAASDIGAYSNLKAAVDLNALYWWHPHCPVSHGPGRDPRIDPDRRPPFCCKSPMRATPEGWECRVGRTLFAYASPLILPTP